MSEREREREWARRFPFADLVAQGHARARPGPGDVWRINSSRVQWRWKWLPPAAASADAAASPAAGGGGGVGQWVKDAQTGHGALRGPLEGADARVRCAARP